MTESKILYQIDDRLARISLNDPDQRNALTYAMVGELIAALRENIGELTPGRDAGPTARRRLTQYGRDHRVSRHVEPAPHSFRWLAFS